MTQVKITVLKRTSNPELNAEYGHNIGLVCERFAEGDEFLLDRMNKPESFCSWAWADIQRDVATIFAGGAHNWMKHPGTMITCCTDGLRPVIFKVERVG
ncbi:MAG: TIGR04076 family protein [Chloroflexi bacterium]|nr:TIGR04076 family protein [Chloroflexota bacterium]